MRFRGSLVALALLATLLVPFSPSASSQSLPEFLPGLLKAKPFSADVVVNSKALPRPTTFKLSYMDQKARIDGPATYIVRLDQGRAYLEQSKGTWLEIDLDTMGGAGAGIDGNATYHAKKLGTRTVLGKTCTAYRITSSEGSVSTQYMIGAYPFYSVIHSAQGTTTVRFLHLHAGAVSPTLFDLHHAKVMDLGSYLKMLQEQGKLGVSGSH